MNYDKYLAKIYLGVILILCFHIWQSDKKDNHISEAERTEAFREGYDTAACEIHRLQLGMEISKCREIEK